MSDTIRQAAEAYIRFWQSMTPDTLDRFADYVTADIRFRDPFNDVRGLDRVKALLAKTYRMLRDVRVEVRDMAFSGPVCYMLWDYSYAMGRSSRRWRLTGISELHFTPDGKVSAHLDHWDAASQIYEKLPVIGAILRTIKRRLEA